MIAAVIFDFDGVLANTEALHLAATQRVLSTVGWTMGAGEYFDRYLGYNDRDLFQHFASDAGHALPADQLARMLAAKADAYQHALETAAVLFDGAEHAVRTLARTFSLGIASGALREEIESILRTRGDLLSCFTTVVSADDPVPGKPSPAPYLEAVGRLGVPPGAAVAVEDSPWGLTSARDAGLKTIAVTTSYGAHALAADVVVPSIADVTIDLVRSLDTAQAPR